MKLLNSYEAMQPLGQFYYAFLEAMLWSSLYYGTDENDELEQQGYHLDEVFSFENIDQQSADMLLDLCKEFIGKAGNDAILENNYSQAGHDFWLTIAGHGAGFWDGDWPINGDTLTELCENMVRWAEVENDSESVYVNISVPKVAAC